MHKGKEGQNVCEKKEWLNGQGDAWETTLIKKHWLCRPWRLNYLLITVAVNTITTIIMN